MKKTLRIGPKSVTNSSAAPRAMSRVADRLERLDRLGLERHVVDPAAAEHRRLPIGLGVALDLEHVELGERPDVDHRQPGTGVRTGVDLPDPGLEHLSVELGQAIGVVGDDRDMVQAIQQHQLRIC